MMVRRVKMMRMMEPGMIPRLMPGMKRMIPMAISRSELSVPWAMPMTGHLLSVSLPVTGLGFP